MATNHTHFTDCYGKNSCHGNRLKQNPDQKNRHSQLSVIDMKDLQLSH